MKQFAKTLLLLSALMAPLLVRANNLTISNVALTNINYAAGTLDISFDVAWQNSWRVSSGPANWDAAWVFVKFYTQEGVWRHANLATNYDSHTPPPGAVVHVGLTGTNGVGAFVYRATNGAGHVNWQGVRLRWPFAAQGVLTNDLITVDVNGIEMVYVPQGSFYAGDGASYGSFQNGSSSSPFLISSENAITLGTSPGNLWAANGELGANLNGVSLPAAFPKGFRAFYCMKYEVSRDQFAQFQWKTGVVVHPYQKPSRSTHPRNGVSDGNYGNTFITTTNTPAVYFSTNAQSEVYGYMGWAGLRPMTELEYEKACRGPVRPVKGEYAWGNKLVTAIIYAVTNAHTEMEGISSGYSEILGNAVSSVSYSGGGYAPLRSGIFARSSYSGNTPPRIQSGATYYGIMEMTGNVPEPVIPVATVHMIYMTNAPGPNLSPTRYLAFDGSHGTGDASTPTWGSNLVHARGGGLDIFYNSQGDGVSRASLLSVSERRWGYSRESGGSGSVSYFNVNEPGVRGVRTAP